MSMKVLINFCSYEDLLNLPGVGSKIAEQMMELRKEKGTLTEDDLIGIPRLRITSSFLDSCDFSAYPPEDDVIAYGPVKQQREHTAMLKSMEGVWASANGPKQRNSGYKDTSYQDPMKLQGKSKMDHGRHRSPSPWDEDEDRDFDQDDELDSPYNSTPFRGRKGEEKGARSKYGGHVEDRDHERASRARQRGGWSTTRKPLREKQEMDSPYDREMEYPGRSRPNHDMYAHDIQEMESPLDREQEFYGRSRHGTRRSIYENQELDPTWERDPEY